MCHDEADAESAVHRRGRRRPGEDRGGLVTGKTWTIVLHRHQHGLSSGGDTHGQGRPGPAGEHLLCIHDEIQQHLQHAPGTARAVDLGTLDGHGNPGLPQRMEMQGHRLIGDRPGAHAIAVAAGAVRVSREGGERLQGAGRLPGLRHDRGGAPRHRLGRRVHGEHFSGPADHLQQVVDVVDGGRHQAGEEGVAVDPFQPLGRRPASVPCVRARIEVHGVEP